jgi:hypothetical protein
LVLEALLVLLLPLLLLAQLGLATLLLLLRLVKAIHPLSLNSQAGQEK